MIYVYSTMSADVNYHLFYTPESRGRQTIDAAKVMRTVTIRGGAGVANKRLETPLGVVTHITEDDLELLRKDETFITHEKNGYVKVQSSKVDVEAVVPDMEPRDESAPFTPEDGLKGDVNVTEKPSGKSGKKEKDRSFVVKNSLS